MVVIILVPREIIQIFATLPLLTTLLGVVGKIWFDYVETRRQDELQEKAQNFELGVFSHMAARVFDEHVNFANSYIDQVNETLTTLFQNGPCKDALKLANELSFIRRKHAVWLSGEIEAHLLPLEKSLREIGSNEEYLDHLAVGDVRSKVVNETHNIFGVVIGLKSFQSDVEADNAITTIITKLRNLIGISELTELRATAINQASERIRTINKLAPNKRL